jgi:hypothetical protein
VRAETNGRNCLADRRFAPADWRRPKRLVMAQKHNPSAERMHQQARLEAAHGAAAGASCHDPARTGRLENRIRASWATCQRYGKSTRLPWITLQPGAKAVPEFCDLDVIWPAESLELTHRMTSSSIVKYAEVLPSANDASCVLCANREPPVVPCLSTRFRNRSSISL